MQTGSQLRRISKNPSRAIQTVVLYGLIHAAVDFCAVITVYHGAYIHGLSPLAAFWLVIFYNGIAFGSQPFFGYLTDWMKKPLLIAMAGIGSVLLGLAAVSINAPLGMAFAGTGNALFHVGCGAMVLQGSRGGCFLPGLFVGPGAIGLSLAVAMGTTSSFPLFILSGILFFSIIALMICPVPQDNGTVARSPIALRSAAWTAILLLLFSIVTRAMGGHTGFGAVSNGQGLILAAGIAACLGKIAGGAIADRFGWTATALTSLALSALCCGAGGHWPVPALTGMFLFQMSMPITLAACSAALPGRPAFAFGLSCMALIAGSLPAFFTKTSSFAHSWVLPALAVFSGGCIYFGLRRLMSAGHIDTL